jgi:hypothetical protein
MEASPIKVHSALHSLETHSTLSDAEFIAALRSAATALAQERKPADGTPSDQPKHPAEQEANRKFGALLARFSSGARALLDPTTALPLAVGAVAFGGVLVFMQLTGDFSQTGKALGQMRREVGFLRNNVVRKEEFNGRHLAAQALIREVEASSRAEADRGLQRLQEQQQTLQELRPPLQDLRRDVGRLRERINAAEAK